MGAYNRPPNIIEHLSYLCWNRFCIRWIQMVRLPDKTQQFLDTQIDDSTLCALL